MSYVVLDFKHCINGNAEIVRLFEKEIVRIADLGNSWSFYH